MMEIRTDAFVEATSLPDATRLGPAVLQVTDLDRSVAFYE